MQCRRIKYDQQEILDHKNIVVDDHMDSLESKLDRLTPIQRREVDDFVDFLLQQSSGSTPAKVLVPRIPDPSGIAPPPFTMQESAPAPEPVPPRNTVIIHAEEAPVISPPPDEAEYPVAQEITVSVDDPVTRDYMDYGRFDQPREEQSSPATEAIKKVRQKLIHKSEQESTNKLLDWID